MIVADTAQGRVTVDPPKTKVGIRLSGGADSAIIAYMLGLYKKQVRDIKIIPITVVNEIKPWQDIYAKAVVRFIENELQIKFEDHVIPKEVIPASEYASFQHSFQRLLYKTGVVECHYTGITLNPPIHEFNIGEEFHQYRDALRDYDGELKSTSTPSGKAVTPLANINKRGVAELYRNYDLIDTLFPITRSCENRRVFHTEPHCGTGCWWCLERQWGFGRLK